MVEWEEAAQLGVKRLTCRSHTPEVFQACLTRLSTLGKAGKLRMQEHEPFDDPPVLLVAFLLHSTDAVSLPKLLNQL